jgi:WD40 repeat protein
VGLLTRGTAGWLPSDIELDASWGVPVELPRLPDREALLGDSPLDIVLSSDNGRIAVALDHDVLVFDNITLDLIARLPAPDGMYFEQLSWNANSSTLLIVGHNSGISPNWTDDLQTLFFFDTETGTIIQQFTDSRLIVAEQYFSTWNRDTTRATFYDRFSSELVFERTNVLTPALSSQNLAATLNLETGQLEIWRFVPGVIEPLGIMSLNLSSEQLSDLKDRVGELSLRFSPDGAFFSFKPPYSSTWTVYELATLREIATFELENWIYTAPDAIPQSAIEQHILAIIPLSDEAQIVQSPNPLWQLSGGFLLIGGDGSYTIWNCLTEQIVMTPSAWIWPRTEIPAAISPDGRWLAISSETGTFDEETIQIIDLATMQVIDEINRKGYRFRWSADSRHLYVNTLYSLSLIEVED